jgi:hypothetical protein
MIERLRDVLGAHRRAVMGFCVIVAFLGGAQIEARADDLSNGAFKREVLALIKRERPQLKATSARRPDSMVVAGGLMALDNLFRLVRDLSGEERKAAILAFVDSAAVSIEPEYPTLASAAGRLRVQIVPADYATQFKGVSKLVSKPLSRHAVVAYAIDEPTRIVYLSQGLLKTWKVDVAEVSALAIANLERISADVPLDTKGGEGEGRYWLHVSDDGYASARILCPDFVTRLKTVLGERFFVGIPSRDTLVAWTPDWTHRVQLAKNVRDVFSNLPHPRSPEIFAMDANGLRLATAEELKDHGR